MSSLHFILMDMARASFALDFTLSEAEHMVRRQLLITALERDGWNQSQVARKLGIHRNTLTRMMAECDIQRPRKFCDRKKYGHETEEERARDIRTSQSQETA